MFESCGFGYSCQPVTALLLEMWACGHLHEILPKYRVRLVLAGFVGSLAFGFFFSSQHHNTEGHLRVTLWSALTSTSLLPKPHLGHPLYVQSGVLA